MKPTLLILAAGMGSRYGGLKQIDPIGPKDEALIEFSIYDAIRAGFGKVVFVIRGSIEQVFKEKFANKFDHAIKVDYAFQEVDSEIEGIDSIPEREKPWGTAHAVLVAKDKINEPFAVINADDYYGITAFDSMVEFLTTRCTPEVYSMIGYVLKNTLSDHGVVNRGVCEMDKNLRLTNIVERLKVRKQDDVAMYLDDDQNLKPLPLDSLVSMNYWGFHPNIFEIIKNDFKDFIKEHGDNPKSEFFIPLVIDQLIQSKNAEIEVIPNGEQWYGVTYREDKPKVEAAFNKLIEENKYPKEGLWN
ncbi:MAG: sugar phosphate nucleotidyltransferase [Bacteroidota bacterium]